MSHRFSRLKIKRSKVVATILQRVFSPKLLAKTHGPFWRRVLFNWERAMERLLPLGGMSDGNHVELFTNGDDALIAMQSAIENAKERVWLETYIFEPDRVGQFIFKALVAAAKRGCEVILLFDHFGSPRMSDSFLAPLRREGGRALSFNPIWPWRKKGPLLFRDHRKILVVDNSIGFCGGMNISAEYAGPRLGSHRFRDTVMKIRGPGIKDLANIFLSSLRETTGEDRVLQITDAPFSDGVFVQVLGSNTRRNLRAIQNSMEVTLQRATRFCYLTSPYFLPYQRLRKGLIEAASHGVQVKILTAGLSDIPLMRLASQHVYGQFLKSGIRIYEMFGKTLHAKTATIDGVYGTVGSYNLDHWSARRNLEVNVSVLDAHVASQLEHHFKEDLKSAKEVTMAHWQERSLFSRFLQWAAYQLMRL